MAFVNRRGEVRVRCVKEALGCTDVCMERKNDECLYNHIWRSRTRSSYHQCVHDKPPNVRNVGDPQCHMLFWHGYGCYVICRRRVSVCVCVCVSVTLRYCIKTAKRRITQITPHDSLVTLTF